MFSRGRKCLGVLDVTYPAAIAFLSPSEKKFGEISRHLSDSGLAAPPLSDGSIVSAQSLGNFLQRVLIYHYDKIWFCPHMMSFIDDEKLSEVEDMRVKSLTKQVREREMQGMVWQCRVGFTRSNF